MYRARDTRLPRDVALKIIAAGARVRSTAIQDEIARAIVGALRDDPRFVAVRRRVSDDSRE